MSERLKPSVCLMDISDSDISTLLGSVIEDSNLHPVETNSDDFVIHGKNCTEFVEKERVVEVIMKFGVPIYKSWDRFILVTSPDYFGSELPFIVLASHVGPVEFLAERDKKKVDILPMPFDIADLKKVVKKNIPDLPFSMDNNQLNSWQI